MTMHPLAFLLDARTPAKTLMLLSLVCGLGAWLGRLKWKGMSIGMAGVLGIGLVCGWQGAVMDTGAKDIALSLGLVLFIYATGIDVGQGFFNSFRRDGATLVLLAATVILSGVGITVLLHKFAGVEIAAAVGILSGSVTNVPSLAAAQEVLQISAAPAGAVALAAASAAAAYPPGMFMVTLGLKWLQKLLKIDIAAEEAEHNRDNARGGALAVLNCRIGIAGAGMRLDDFCARYEAAVSRIKRGREIWVPPHSQTLLEGDIIICVAPASRTEEIIAALGERAEEDLRREAGIDSVTMLVTAPEACGRTLGKLGFPTRVAAMITRVRRSGMEFVAGQELALELGDEVVVVGQPQALETASKTLGNKPGELEKTDAGALFIGMALGVLIGFAPLPVPGLPFPVRLGVAGGSIIISVLLGRIQRTGSLVWRIPHNTNMLLREFGIVLFFAVVGVDSGKPFADALAAGQGFAWICYSAVIALPPVIIGGLLARFVFKLNFLRICGMLAGATTNPPAMVYANSLSSREAAPAATATVYPVTLLLRITTAQLLVMIFTR